MKRGFTGDDSTKGKQPHVCPLSGRWLFVLVAALFCVAGPRPAMADSISNFAVRTIASNAREVTVDYNYSSNHGDHVFLSVEAWNGSGKLEWVQTLPVPAVHDSHQHRVTLVPIYAYSGPPPSANSTQMRVILFDGYHAPFFSRTFSYVTSWSVPGAYPTLWQPSIKVHVDWDLDRDSSEYQRVRETIQALNDRLYDATDGQVRLGKVTVYDRNSPIDPEGSGTVHFHRNWPMDSHHGGASGVAHSSGRPSHPEHAHLQLKGSLAAARAYGGTALMEFLHSWTGLRDEYEKEGGQPSACPDNADRTYDTCLMDDTSRTELCKYWNHNPLTEQGTSRGMDCWAWLKTVLHDDLGINLINLPVYLYDSANAPDPPIELAILRVEVTTADVGKAGTDDDVYLRLGTREWELDNPDQDDFERGHRDAFYLPVPESFQITDIHSLQIRKSSDGLAGGWKLGGIRVYLNGAPVYANNSINRWLEDDHRTWSANF